MINVLIGGETNEREVKNLMGKLLSISSLNINIYFTRESGQCSQTQGLDFGYSVILVNKWLIQPKTDWKKRWQQEAKPL